MRLHSLRVAVAASGLAVALGAAGVVVAAGGVQASHSAKSVVVVTFKTAKLGHVLESSGRALYTLNKTDCNATCLKYWPALVLPAGVSSATAGAGVSAGKLGRVKTKTGQWQVTYAGKALYKFFMDHAPSQVTGNKVKDTWGTWLAVIVASSTPAGGGSVTTTAPAVTTTTAPGGGGGGGVAF
ncbi:MAG: hypothetical protein ACRDV0_07820 [Acidimicrobiales bacterium]